jgi:hypothetical protein
MTRIARTRTLRSQPRTRTRTRTRTRSYEPRAYLRTQELRTLLSGGLPDVLLGLRRPDSSATLSACPTVLRSTFSSPGPRLDSYLMGS